MSRLPKAELAVVDERKIAEYVLSTGHPFGRAKAAFFRSFGFRLTAWEGLKAALLRHAQENEVTGSEETPFGTKYVIDGPLHAPDGRRPMIRTVWFVETGEEGLRFVTTYPLKGKGGAP